MYIPVPPHLTCTDKIYEKNTTKGIKGTKIFNDHTDALPQTSFRSPLLILILKASLHYTHRSYHTHFIPPHF